MPDKTTKQLPTLGISGAISGYVLKEKGFTEIHEVMDHLFPGIMTLGCAAMGGHAKDELSRQLPKLAEFLGTYAPKRFAKDTQEVAADILGHFGPTLPVEGPLAVTRAEINVAFASLS